jgi:hypothetical protein
MKFFRSLMIAASGMTAAAALAVSAQAQTSQATTFYPSISHATPDIYSNAQVAVFYKSTSGIVRYKHVSTVTRPSIGTYCIHATVPLSPNAIVPIATPEYSGSTVNTMFVYVVDNNADCSGDTNTVDVRTYTLVNGVAQKSNGVSFYMSIT